MVHFAGHTRLDGSDPLAGSLATSAGQLALHEVLGAGASSSLVVLSACESLVGRRIGSIASTADEMFSLAASFRLAGARSVLATTTRVSDVAAAALMKRFYRAARDKPLVDALRDAQLALRRYHPHPGWWATFSLVSG